MKFNVSICPKCGRKSELMFNNNPIGGSPICFNCIKETLSPYNIEHADLFCRTYNLPFKPEEWMMLAKEQGAEVFKYYTELCIEDETLRPNLYYEASTKDVWARLNKEWERTRSFTQILDRIKPIKESYIERGKLKWGHQYTFAELIKLDSIYTRTLRANNITNPLQKEAVKTLCKLQIEMDEAIVAKDAKAIKDFSNAWSTFAKQADLETMINETKTDDITTVAELYDYMEKSGFKFKYFQGGDKDEVDRAITDIQESNRRLILESTGLHDLLEEMARQRMESKEEEYTRNIVESSTLQEMLDFSASDGTVDTESDEEAEQLSFEEEVTPTLTIKRKDN